MKFVSTTFSIYAATAFAHSFLDAAFGIDEVASQTNRLLQQQNIMLNPLRKESNDDEFFNIPADDYVKDIDPNSPNAPHFAGIVTFAKLPQTECFNIDPNNRPEFDVAILGAPFDTATTYRPGARFGPSGIREGARRMGKYDSSSSIIPGFNPYDDWAKVVECGDVPMTPFDNRIALNQLYRAHRQVHNHSVPAKETEPDVPYKSSAPRIITLGGDHTITFAALRSVSEVHGPVSVIHFDSHIDTWDPKALGGNISSYSELNHGTFLHFAHEKGYLNADGNAHVGIRAPFIRKKLDKEHDEHDCGFKTVMARDVDLIGVRGVINKLKEIVGDNKVYITVDIDVLDPAYAPGTGTAEPGGFTTRELLTILDGLHGLNVVGADVVEVSPAYDTNGQITVMAAAQVVDSLLGLMVLELN